MPRRTITLDNCLNDESARASDPPDTGVALFPHQKAALYAMNQLEMSTGISSPAFPDELLKTRIGVLGDKPGAGKSYVILALALSGNRESTFNGVHEYSISTYASVTRKDSKAFTPTSVIVIPHGLSKQWGDYLRAYMPEETNNILINRRKQFSELTRERLQGGFYTVIIVTTTMLPVLVSKLNGNMNIRVSRVFYDECDGIDVKHTNHIHAGFYWFVSASFHNLLTPRGGMVTLPDGRSVSVYGYYNTHLRAFFDAFQTVREDLVKQIAVFCDEGFIDRSLNLPEPIVRTVVCKTPYSVRVLRGHVRDSIIRALNGGDVDAAIRSMGAICDTESNIVSSVMEGYRREKRGLEARLNYLDDFDYYAETQRDAERTRCMHRIADLERNMTSISERVKESVTCPICYEEYKNKTIVSCCQNSFCLVCITEWVNSGIAEPRCPMCKAPVQMESCMVCYEGEAGTSSDAQDAGVPYMVGDVAFTHKGEKLENLMRLVTETDPSRKFLVFSEYDYMLEQSIAETLRARGIGYGMLKRNIHTINKVVNNFKEGDLRVLLINSAHYGCGMNLPEATDVVIMHRLREGKSYSQVVGRAQRCQRRTPLNVWCLFNDNEVEDARMDEIASRSQPLPEVEDDISNYTSSDDGEYEFGYVSRVLN